MFILSGFCILFTAWAALISTKWNGNFLLDFGKFNFWQQRYMLGVYTHLIILIVGYFASLFLKSKEVDKDLTIYAWYDKLKKEDQRVITD